MPQAGDLAEDDQMDEEFIKASQFHGHICPGLAIGYRVAKYVLGHFPRSEDEELVALAENKSCSIDAIQYMLGCTMGKGNLVLQDNGKQAFTFFSRDRGVAMRIYFKMNLSQRMDAMRKSNPDLGEAELMRRARQEAVEYILEASDEDLLEVSDVDLAAPRKARIYPTLHCQECGEGFMEIRGRAIGGKVVCQGCFDRLTT